MQPTSPVRPARAEELVAVQALLAAAGLPVQGVAEHFAHFVVVEQDGQVVGAAGLELHDQEGLLRSVVVSNCLRGLGLGERLTQAIVGRAHALRLHSLSLLTTTAEAYFARLGFERVPRGELPPSLNRSRELCGVCPSSAAAMTMRLGPVSWTAGSCETNGIQLHYLRTGAGGALPPLLLLHGLMGSGACWTPVARALDGELDVVMPDARGHGGSSAPHHGYRYDDHAKDVAGLIRGLKLARPVLVGHSMGGMTAALVASQRLVTLRALILVDPTFLSPERQREVHDSDVAEQHRRALGLQKSDLIAQAQVRHPRRAPELIERLAEARLKTRPEAFDVLTPPNPDYRDVVSALEVPTLLVIGDSPVVTIEQAAELRSLNPRVQVEQIEDAGHGLPFDQPERLGEVVKRFLRSVAAA